MKNYLVKSQMEIINLNIKITWKSCCICSLDFKFEMNTFSSTSIGKIADGNKCSSIELTDIKRYMKLIFTSHNDKHYFNKNINLCSIRALFFN